jgi:hypothetical protein
MSTRSCSSSRSAKRVKLDQDTSYAHRKEVSIKESTDEEEDSVDCTICLQNIVNRTVIPKCSHEFCFECLLVWTGWPFNLTDIEFICLHECIRLRTIQKLSPLLANDRRVSHSFNSIKIRLSKTLSCSSVVISTP